MFLLAAALLMQTAAEPPTDWDKEFGVEEKVRDPVTGELPVDPYVQSNANAGAAPFSGGAMATAFDMVRLKRTLFEQFCYILNAGCDYSGRDMPTSHKDMGVRMRDMNALVENLQTAMREEKVGFAAQNRFLAKLAPMSRDVVTR